MKSLLQDNNIEVYSTHNEEKSAVAERFISTLKTKIYKYMTSISKNVCIDKLDNIVNKYNKNFIEQWKKYLLMLNRVPMLTAMLAIKIKILNLKLVAT